MIETLDVNSHAHRGAAVRGRLRVFSLYLDFPGSLRARWANCTLSQLAGENWITSTEMWRLDSIASSPAILKLSTGEAARADVLLVVVNSLNYREHELIEWLAALARHATDRRNPGLLLALFGDDEKQNSELQWTVQQCQDWAGPMNRDFLWNKMDAGPTLDQSWLKQHLELFLDRKHRTSEQEVLAKLRCEVTADELPALAA